MACVPACHHTGMHMYLPIITQVCTRWHAYQYLQLKDVDQTRLHKVISVDLTELPVHQAK